MTGSIDLSNERSVAKAVKAIREADSKLVSHQTLAVNLVWTIHEFTKEMDFDEIEVTDDEVAEIINDLPTDFDTEAEA